MITRIKISGFKSLVDVDVELGPFTCIAGANAVGKSNLFDALMFLANLADKTLVEAAKSVRSDDRKYAMIRDIFHRSGDSYDDEMRFEVSLLISEKTEDDFGQLAVASITSLQYNLELKYNESDEENPITVLKEELLPIPLRDARRNVHFYATPAWKNAVIKGRKTTPFISCENGKVKIHQDTRGGGPVSYSMAKMQRTLLSSATAEYPTAFMVRHEFRSWKMLQLEPSALRQPDDFDARRHARLAPNGAHLAATLYRLHNEHKDSDIYQEVTNKLSRIIDGLDYVSIDKDDKRELLTLQVKYKDGAAFKANTLSDGTLRFLGLTVLELDNKADGVICFEEPENGIHPSKISAIVELLRQIAVDTDYAVDEDNPFRQVIINTHSPLVVGATKEDSLLMADLEEYYDNKSRSKFARTVFKGLDGTWRVRDGQKMVSKGELISFLNPPDDPDFVGEIEQGTNGDQKNARLKKTPAAPARVKDRPEVKQLTLSLQ